MQVSVAGAIDKMLTRHGVMLTRHGVMLTRHDADKTRLHHEAGNNINRTVLLTMRLLSLCAQLSRVGDLITAQQSLPEKLCCLS